MLERCEHKENHILPLDSRKFQLQANRKSTSISSKSLVSVLNQVFRPEFVVLPVLLFRWFSVCVHYFLSTFKKIHLTPSGQFWFIPKILLVLPTYWKCKALILAKLNSRVVFKLCMLRKRSSWKSKQFSIYQFRSFR